MKQSTKNLFIDAFANIVIICLFVGACVGAVWIFKGPTEPTAQETTLTSDELFLIEKYINDLETLNDINKELIEVYELRLLQCSGELHSS